MIVRQNGRSSVDVERTPHDFPGVDGGSIDRSGEHPLDVEDAVALVQPHDVELFVLERSEPDTEEFGRVRRCPEVPLALQPALEEVIGCGEDVVLPPGPWTRWNVRQRSRSKTWDARARCRRRSALRWCWRC